MVRRTTISFETCLRLQLADKRSTWDNLPETVRRSVVRNCENSAEKGGGFHKVGIEVVLKDAIITDVVSQTEDHLVKLCAHILLLWKYP